MTATHAHGAGAVDAKSRESPSAPPVALDDPQTTPLSELAACPEGRSRGRAFSTYAGVVSSYRRWSGGSVRRSPWRAYRAALSRERGEEGRIDRVDNALDDRHRTNTRIRLGVAHCIEFLVDLPDYFHSIRSRGPTGFSDLASAAKAQLGPLPGGIVLSETVGLGFPTGASRISGHAYNPYIQFPWSREIGGGWCVSGMFTQFWFPGQQKSNAISEATFVVEREVGPTPICSSNTLAITRITAGRAKSSTTAVPIGLPLLSKSIFTQDLD